ncbi:AdeA/AdeI family multidrug efflux RND transporter periplasmic adaptor subunit [Acinetobacter haemolyticus]|uniref:AdeA/AdeI family multidrug efflux RND transporter periplasmic adaptor subunit n=1 Tax=Acinetobacter haemolyticus TaxID=29430 RepID=UPI000E57E9AD|nr:AdeA/AdeI family multidrug efflux RND transporter periplasmic adaptor subunit [Acinetobacter haemolyticus]NAR88053.1 AdeA/AdeI family multidrug efflux RND transporter periplasmic adaptor subunit [Acinetobacter haemolyticus]NAR95121.1 AdeA/AdeI family multidrug efflux RND transporter periplasmic adaptor subunit [Acinetobacter haemolyticus]NAS07314.1 AdeA/AdeI family multidrug efflux RND transporter periplasmic adaptor subunit [Acinetobacter haemolyticus]QDJ91524.1 AdeA/AdeI family multidrug e
MMSAKLWAPALTACALATSIALVGCSKDTNDAQQAAAAKKMPPAEVGVIVAQPQSIEQNVELSGRTSAYQISEVRPQTSGVILKRLFTEGSYVSEGQALYELDSRANRAALDNAKAALLQQQANLSSLRTKLNRYQQLVSSNAVSKQEYDDLLGQVRVSEAQVAAAQAQVKNAEVDFGYSTIRSPISGQSGRSSVTAGALVTANQTAPLVTIQQLDPIYVDINQSSAELLRLRQQLSKGSLSNSNNTKVKLKLEDGSTYPIEGQLTFSDASVNQDTGTVTLRAVFSNPNHLLLPGMYATAKISQGIIPNAYLIPQVAVSRLPTGQAIALIVNAKNTVEARPITTVGVKAQDWIVTDGLQAGDKIVVDGVAKVKEGQQVSVKPYQPQAKAPQGQNATPPAAAEQQKQADSAKAEQKATSQA